eukprot:11505316-Alexandrium_andersonii.AAC.1
MAGDALQPAEAVAPDDVDDLELVPDDREERGPAHGRKGRRGLAHHLVRGRLLDCLLEGSRTAVE